MGSGPRNLLGTVALLNFIAIPPIFKMGGFKIKRKYFQSMVVYSMIVVYNNCIYWRQRGQFFESKNIVILVLNF